MPPKGGSGRPERRRRGGDHLAGAAQRCPISPLSSWQSGEISLMSHGVAGTPAGALRQLEIASAVNAESARPFAARRTGAASPPHDRGRRLCSVSGRGRPKIATERAHAWGTAAPEPSPPHSPRCRIGRGFVSWRREGATDYRRAMARSADAPSANAAPAPDQILQRSVRRRHASPQLPRLRPGRRAGIDREPKLQRAHIIGHLVHENPQLDTDPHAKHIVQLSFALFRMHDVLRVEHRPPHPMVPPARTPAYRSWLARKGGVRPANRPKMRIVSTPESAPVCLRMSLPGSWSTPRPRPHTDSSCVGGRCSARLSSLGSHPDCHKRPPYVPPR